MFPPEGKTDRDRRLNIASGLLAKSSVSSSLCDEVPHIFSPKSHLEPREFLISSANRLLQQYRHIRWGNRPAGVSIAGDFGCCASG